MNLLVTGGAGYVGSHAVARLLENGHRVWVWDDLSRGHAAAVPAEVLVRGDLHERERLTALLREKRIEGVMHFAAFALVGESVANPAMYYRNNVEGTLSLLEAMRRAEVPRIVSHRYVATGCPRAANSFTTS